MAIDSNTAADIAVEYGLGLSDARALAAMSENADDARQLAEKFAPADDPEKIADRILGKRL